MGDNDEIYVARIAVIGCGGGGNNTVSNLTKKQIKGALTIAINTDVKHLQSTDAHKRLLIGKMLTRGLGAGGFPEIGKNAALESKDELRSLLKDIDLLFVTCGLGGGTGTGSAPVAARLAKEQGSIVIGAVTLPFNLEGARIKKAVEGLNQLRQVCDTVIVIENQKLLEFVGTRPLKQAFSTADDLIATMIKGITETISEPALVNLDYADVKAVMRNGGVASIGIGESDSDKRALDAVTKAMNNPLIEVDYRTARGALIQITGGEDMTLDEINMIGEYVQAKIDPGAHIIWGARVLPEYRGKIQAITIITGVNSNYILGPTKAPVVQNNPYGINMIK